MILSLFYCLSRKLLKEEEFRPISLTTVISKTIVKALVNRLQVILAEKENGGMGFKDLKYLNLAFLAKQCWRLVQQPDLLLSKLLKACYFKYIDFWNATLGYRTSACWRIMLKAMDLLRMGTSFNNDGGVFWNRSSSESLYIKSAYKVARELYAGRNEY
ncbi:hypothetical protein QQ045_009033 [Rhodiola kirilowii]